MPEYARLPVRRSAEELHRHRLARIRARQWAAATVAAGVTIVALAATLLWPPRPRLVWNGSASSPVGLYQVTPADEFRAGETVLAWPPDGARRLASARRYVPANVPLVKRVAAARGDRVCAAGEAVFVNSRFVALRRSRDSRRRPLPWWTGCAELKDGELFLLMPGAPDSFDGRYFGLTERRHVIGRARLIWAR